LSSSAACRPRRAKTRTYWLSAARAGGYPPGSGAGGRVLRAGAAWRLRAGRQPAERAAGPRHAAGEGAPRSCESPPGQPRGSSRATVALPTSSSACSSQGRSTLSCTSPPRRTSTTPSAAASSPRTATSSAPTCSSSLPSKAGTSAAASTSAPTKCGLEAKQDDLLSFVEDRRFNDAGPSRWTSGRRAPSRT
jgi:hypothetical protein